VCVCGGVGRGLVCAYVMCRRAALWGGGRSRRGPFVVCMVLSIPLNSMMSYQ